MRRRASERVDGCALGFEREAAEPSDRGALVVVGVVTPYQQTDPERVIERDSWQFASRCDYEQLVARSRARRKRTYALPWLVTNICARACQPGALVEKTLGCVLVRSFGGGAIFGLGKA